MKISLVQMKIQEKNKDANVQHGLELLQKAVIGQDIAVMPEIWTTGYSLGRLEKEADEIDGPVVKNLQKIAKDNNCAVIAGSIPLLLDGKVHNTSVVINKNGEIIYLYSKMHLFGMFKEERFFAAGDTYEPFVLDGVACGASICYDLRFPELYRRLAIKGAKVIFVPAEWPESRGDVWRLLLQARAVENQTYICGVNCVGTFKDDIFYGHSMIVAPNGKILVEGSSEEEILRGEIDIDLVETMRKKLNALDDVRPEIFAR
ncbi:MAG: carbon-nitrogen family hydrolase [Acholeplasmataceae bacterium]|nr:carbon-nitrogen family hydrolase [Acholeplasmataceae bacterium]